MRAVRSLVAVVVVLAVALAGCTKGEEVSGGDGPGTRLPPGALPGGGGVTPGDGTGTIVGVVLTADFSPIDGARVRLMVDGKQVQQELTSAQGAFRMDDVPTGRHRLEVSASCCREEVQAVSVDKDRTTQVSLRLEPRSAADQQRPYAVKTPWDGFIGCGVSLEFFHESPCVLDSNDDRVFSLNVTAGLRTLYVRIDWEATTALGEELLLQVDAGEARVIATETAKSPLELLIQDADIEEEDLKWSSIESRREIFLRVAPGGVSVSFQQAFRVSIFEFYWLAAPEGFTYDPAA